MIIRMNHLILTRLAAHADDRDVGDDFVGIHVHGCAGTALNRINDELIQVFPGDDLVAGSDDDFSLFRSQFLRLHVGDGAGLFQLGHAADEYRVHTFTGNREILLCPQ